MAEMVFKIFIARVQMFITAAVVVEEIALPVDQEITPGLRVLGGKVVVEMEM